MERIAFSLAEVAEATGQSVPTLRKHVRAGRLQVVRPAGGANGKVYVLATERDRYLSPEPKDGE